MRRMSRAWYALCGWCAFVAGAHAGEIAGFAAADTRAFWHAPAASFQDNRRFVPSLVLQPEYRASSDDGADRLTTVLFARADSQDNERTHADIRELNWLHRGADWDLRLGIGKVFWGVTESRHLVNIINQTDRVEDIDEEDKLGQPMVNLDLIREWGKLSLYALPYFRERTFPGPEGRLGLGVPVTTARAVYESNAQEKHLDTAIRWQHSLGVWDIGLAHFRGTGREPRLVVEPDAAGMPLLVPYHDIINQTGIDLQATNGAWLWKLEAIRRTGQGKPFTATVAGFEYAMGPIAESGAELGWQTEYLYDGRDASAPRTPFNNDVFLGLRLALNDAHGGEIRAGAIVDRDSHAQIWNLEASRRLGDQWAIRLLVRGFTHVPTEDVLYGMRQDDFIQLTLKRFF